MAQFILVAGAWHGSWCWEWIIPPLQEAGHHVLAPDLKGTGDDDTLAAAITLRDWVDQISDAVAARPEPVVLVGHSRAGIVISAVAEREPQNLAGLVYVAAALVPPGEAMGAVLAQVPPSFEWSADAVDFDTKSGFVRMKPEHAGALFYNRTGESQIMRALERLRPEPFWSFGTPLELTASRYGSVRRAYVECTEDRAVPLNLQRIMQQAQPCDPVFTLEADHSPFYSAPESLIVCLEEAAGKWAAR